MNSLAASTFDSLFGLTKLSFTDDHAALGWRTPLDLWVWVLIITASVIYAGWTYNRLLGKRAARITLAALRTLLIVFIAALLAGPMLVVEDHHVEEDWLLVLVDRSASMNIRDVIDDAGVNAISRDEALRTALAEQLDVFSNERLGKNRRIVWLGFDRFSREIETPMVNAQSILAKLPDADGQATSIRTAVEQALQRAVGRPISGIVLFTDGRSPQATGAELVSRLKRQRIGVYAVPLGSQQTPLNIAVGRVDIPERAFVNDTIPIRVTIEYEIGRAHV